MRPSRETGQCATCAYAVGLPGSCHTRCTFNWSADDSPAPPAGNLHGIKNGWYWFPLNYDPVWMAEPCQAHSSEKDPDKIAPPPSALAELISMLR